MFSGNGCSSGGLAPFTAEFSVAAAAIRGIQFHGGYLCCSFLRAILLMVISTMRRGGYLSEPRLNRISRITFFLYPSLVRYDPRTSYIIASAARRKYPSLSSRLINRGWMSDKVQTNRILE